MWRTFRTKTVRFVAIVAPGACVTDFLSTAFYGRLIEAGWIVAMSSYRREGLIVRDAMDDVRILRSFIVKERGEAKLVMLEGRSMGGAITTYIAESADATDLYQVHSVGYCSSFNMVLASVC